MTFLVPMVKSRASGEGRMVGRVQQLGQRLNHHLGPGTSPA